MTKYWIVTALVGALSLGVPPEVAADWKATTLLRAISHEILRLLQEFLKRATWMFAMVLAVTVLAAPQTAQHAEKSPARVHDDITLRQQKGGNG